MELSNQSKRPRKEEPDFSSATTMRHSRDDLQETSPYERKMGKVILSCTKCMVEGKVRAPLSKKARARRNRMQDAAPNGTLVQPQMKACRACDGSRLIAASPSDSTDGTKGETGKAKQASPQMHPGVSVAIVGGGIGGIALAVALQHCDIPCTVYERDMSFEERKQGYGLTMQQGARALRSLGFFSFSDDDDSAHMQEGADD